MHCNKSISLPARKTSSLDIFQLLFDVFATYLRVSNCGLDCWHSPVCYVPEVVGDLLQAPSGIARAMSKIMTQVMKTNILNEFRLATPGLPLELLPPVVKTIFRPSVCALRGEEIGTIAVPFFTVQVLIEREPDLVQQIDGSGLLILMSNRDPAGLDTEVRMLDQQVRHIAYPAPSPKSERKGRLSAQIRFALNEIAQGDTLVFFQLTGASKACAGMAIPRVGLRESTCLSSISQRQNPLSAERA